MSTLWDWFWGVVGIVGGFGAIAGLVWLQSRGDPERKREEDARAHYDVTGSWPDQSG